ncbi:MAG: TIGR03668 family PPOX class F420-dependent oxidoreductase [Candidatus Binataceae bacterium]
MAEDTLKALEEARISEFLALARVARLATSDMHGAPHNIPLCFWFDGVARFYFVIDEKPKRLTPTGLKRMRNIAANPKVALIVDHYEEEWSYLAYVLVHGEAHVVDDPNEYMLALRNLRDKYPQYRTMVLSLQKNPMVRIDAHRVHAWGERFKASKANG